MIALTLHQPWAWAIAHGGKRLENRDWCPTGAALDEVLRGIAIHAGKTAPDEAEWAAALEASRQVLGAAAPERPVEVPLGAVVAVARVLWIGDGAAGDWPAIQQPWYAGSASPWLLGDVIPLPTPVPCRGYQRLWWLPREVDEEVAYQAAKGAELVDQDLERRVVGRVA